MNRKSKPKAKPKKKARASKKKEVPLRNRFNVCLR